MKLFRRALPCSVLLLRTGAKIDQKSMRTAPTPCSHKYKSNHPLNQEYQLSNMKFISIPNSHFLAVTRKHDPSPLPPPHAHTSDIHYQTQSSVSKTKRPKDLTTGSNSAAAQLPPMKNDGNRIPQESNRLNPQVCKLRPASPVTTWSNTPSPKRHMMSKTCGPQPHPGLPRGGREASAALPVNSARVSLAE